ncbi:SlyX family protein [Agaribacterium sp. ZY112]|uniref:SlyX family protein n=1 Tax=Agaribacterium sp. ZY112 TaxID=3233574 RepID=UPI00352468F4
MSDLQQQITDLQSRLVHQEDWLQAMNARIAEQDNEIARLQLQTQHLAALLKESQSSEGAAGFNAADERPPHY